MTTFTNSSAAFVRHSSPDVAVYKELAGKGVKYLFVRANLPMLPEFFTLFTPVIQVGLDTTSGQGIADFKLNTGICVRQTEWKFPRWIPHIDLFPVDGCDPVKINQCIEWFNKFYGQVCCRVNETNCMQINAQAYLVDDSSYQQEIAEKLVSRKVTPIYTLKHYSSRVTALVGRYSSRNSACRVIATDKLFQTNYFNI